MTEGEGGGGGEQRADKKREETSKITRDISN